MRLAKAVQLRAEPDTIGFNRAWYAAKARGEVINVAWSRGSNVEVGFDTGTANENFSEEAVSDLNSLCRRFWERHDTYRDRDYLWAIGPQILRMRLRREDVNDFLDDAEEIVERALW